MCYNIQLLAARIKKSGKRQNKSDEELEKAMELIKKQWAGKPMFSLYGFDFPTLPIISRKPLDNPMEAQWGLIPHWCTDIEKQKMLRHQTLNARIESIDSKPAFRSAFEINRCIIPLTGYYEFKHFGKRAIPHFLFPKDEETLWLAGIYDEVEIAQNKLKTFSIVTTKANAMAASIHNQAKSDGPRMPLILDFATADTWLNDSPLQALEMARSIQTSEDYLQAHMVQPLRGAHSPGNSETASKPHIYTDLIVQGNLFD
jgi:putative SOS response-associated peptidase YedK